MHIPHMLGQIVLSLKGLVILAAPAPTPVVFARESRDLGVLVHVAFEVVVSVGRVGAVGGETGELG